MTSSGLRFAVEVIAWVAGPWAAGQVALWLATPALVLLVGLPSVISTTGDKRQVVVPTPGPLRAVLEFLLHVIAIVAPWLVWPPVVADVMTLVVAAARRSSEWMNTGQSHLESTGRRTAW